MTRNEFLTQLDKKLSGLSYQDKKDILYDYEEHFQIALSEGKSEEEICKILGEPEEISTAYLSQTERNAIPGVRVSGNEAYETYDSKTSSGNSKANFRDSAFTYAADSINAIEGNVVFASIELKRVNGLKHIEVEVTYKNAPVSNLEQYNIEVSDNDGVLKVLQKGGNMFFNRNFFMRMNVFITIRIPEAVSLNKVALNSVSGNIVAHDFTSERYVELRTVSGVINACNLIAKTMSFNSVSGNISGSSIDSPSVEISNVSGLVKYSGNPNKISINTVSGNIELNADNNILIANISTISANAFINVPEERSFKCRYSSMNGKFRTNFQTPKMPNRGQFSYIMENSDYKPFEIECSTISGDLNLNR